MASWVKRWKSIRSSASASSVLTYEKAKVDLHGVAMIPYGTQEVGAIAFEKSRKLRKVQLPDSVKSLGNRAFADCENLEKVVLNEGLESIASNVFTGCKNLKTLVLPDSLKEVHVYAFYRTGLQSPVYNRSGTILYRYPSGTTDSVFRVPPLVTRLHEGAFFEDTAMEEVILPEGLEIIDSRAFLETNIRRITIPASVKQIESEAFWNCPELELVELLCDESALEPGIFYRCPSVQIKLHGMQPDFEQELYIRGIDLLEMPRRLQVPEGDFWKTKDFAQLVSRCAEGNTGAMLEFADYLDGLGKHEFFRCAANFWRYRACRYGDAQAQSWKLSWLNEHPRQRIPSAMSSKLSGNFQGVYLRAMGFSFFDPERDYSLDGVDKNGIVLVSSWCDSDGPDEDGFGREEYYDWWYLDEHLNRIPGIWSICCSNRDRHLLLKDRFHAQYTKAQKVLSKQ